MKLFKETQKKEKSELLMEANSRMEDDDLFTLEHVEEAMDLLGIDSDSSSEEG